jgi:hypothetical protein
MEERIALRRQILVKLWECKTNNIPTLKAAKVKEKGVLPGYLPTASKNYRNNKGGKRKNTKKQTKEILKISCRIEFKDRFYQFVNYIFKM